jgi:hypothetical protein
MKKSENVNEIAKAMSCFQGQMKPALKDSSNPFFKSRYSNLESVWNSIREPLCNNGLTALQDVFTTDNGVSICTTIIHCSGQWIEFGPLEIPITKKDAQSIGSATSYGKRYALCAACGVVSGDEDDDGEKAMNRNAKEDKSKKGPNPDDSPIIDYDKRKVLHNLANSCDKSYLATLYSYIESQGVKGFENITEKLYPRILKGMTQNAQANRDKNV